MKVVDYQQVPAAPVDMEGAAECQIRCLIGQEDGAPSFSMRHFELGPGGHTPKHVHAHEHEVFVLKGEGAVVHGESESSLRPGSVVFVPPQVEHQFRNTGGQPMEMLCLIPHPLREMNGPCAAACGCE